ncbi:MAG: hypothetical protein N4A41_12260 [Crocinitomicaceae bacterium]|nr:hypothetical protein [Crocinitomicaceae bacterium]
MKNYKLLLATVLLFSSALCGISQESQDSTFSLFNTCLSKDSLLVQFHQHKDCNTVLRITDDYNREVWKTCITPLTESLQIFCGALQAGNYHVRWEGSEGEFAKHELIISH